MQTKRFVAADMRRALTLVRDELGEDAMILSTQRTNKGVEIIATLEEVSLPPASPKPTMPSAPTTQTSHQPQPNSRQAEAAFSSQYSEQLMSQQPQQATQQAPKVGLASGKTQDELAQELEAARRRMLAMQQRENMTITEWADQQSSDNASKDYNRGGNRHAQTMPRQDTAGHSNQYQTNPQQATTQRAMQSTATSEQEVKTVIKRDNEEIRRLKDEISSMRVLFENQLFAMAEAQERQYEDQQVAQDIIPIATEIRQRLNHLGLTRACNDQVIRTLRNIDDDGMSKEALWTESLARLAHKIPAITTDPVATGGIYAFLGTTGVGKTTTIAKLAARYVMEHGPEQVALLTTDTFRIASHDQLRSLGRILNVQVKVVDDLQQLPQILSTFSKQALVLIDTPGMSYNDPLLKQHLTALRRCKHVQTCLAISANSQYQMMQASLHSYRIANPRFCVMTKLDECASLGDAISLLTANDLPLAYITNGQSVPDDLSVMKPHQLISKAVSLSQRSELLKSQPSQSV